MVREACPVAVLKYHSTPRRYGQFSSVPGPTLESESLKSQDHGLSCPETCSGKDDSAGSHAPQQCSVVPTVSTQTVSFAIPKLDGLDPVFRIEISDNCSIPFDLLSFCMCQRGINIETT